MDNLKFHPATREEIDRFREQNDRCVTGHEQGRVCTSGSYIVSCDMCQAPDFTESLAKVA